MQIILIVLLRITKLASCLPPPLSSRDQGPRSETRSGTAQLARPGVQLAVLVIDAQPVLVINSFMAKTRVFASSQYARNEQRKRLAPPTMSRPPGSITAGRGDPQLLRLGRIDVGYPLSGIALTTFGTSAAQQALPENHPCRQEEGLVTSFQEIVHTRRFRQRAINPASNAEKSPARVRHHALRRVARSASGDQRPRRRHRRQPRVAAAW